MLDLIGFWTAVTILIGLMLCPILIALLYWLDLIISSALPKEVADKVTQKIWYYRGGVTTFFSRYKLLDEAVIVLVALGLFAWVPVLLDMHVEGRTPASGSIVVTVSSFSQGLTPIFSWVGIFLGVYIGGVFAVRWAYKGSLFVAKVNDHLSDEDKHNAKADNK